MADREIRNVDGIIHCISSLKATDGGYANQQDLPMGLTLLIPIGSLFGYFYEKWAARTSNAEFAQRMGVLLATGLIVLANPAAEPSKCWMIFDICHE